MINLNKDKPEILLVKNKVFPNEPAKDSWSKSWAEVLFALCSTITLIYLLQFTAAITTLEIGGYIF